MSSIDPESHDDIPTQYTGPRVQTGQAESPAPPPSRRARYLLLDEIGRGGMGIVYRARDLSIGRELAVKVLQSAADTQVERLLRFDEEARLTGQLQHPGIPPVHEVGILHDGRPFFAMKLVQGRTLAQLLAKRADPGEGLPHFLGIFEQICQTVGYAHSRGVVHRDLKPGNVMVGAFSEVQVMDWGLAKQTRDEPAPELQSIADSSEVAGSSSDWTQPGAMIGTLSYMPPEQAQGQGSTVTPAADVFGLGAILCEILTGKPPYTGPTRETIRVKAQDSDLRDAEARLANCQADAELVDLVRRCLQRNPAERPKDGGEVAQAVSAWQEGVREKLRQAEMRQVKAGEKRMQRRLVAWLAVAVLTAITLGAGGGLWLHSQEERHQAERSQAAERENQAVENALAQVDQHRRRQRWNEALAVLAQALQQVENPDLCAKLAQAKREIVCVEKLDELLLQQNVMLQEKVAFPRSVAFATTLREVGVDLDGADPEQVSELVRSSPIKEQLLIALEYWLALEPHASQRQSRLRTVLRQADPDPWREQLRLAIVEFNQAALLRLERQADLHRLPTPVLLLLVQRIGHGKPESASLLRRVQRVRPGDVWLNWGLGTVLICTPETQDEGIGHLLAALGHRPDSGPIHNNLGTAFRLKHDLDRARWHLEAGRRVAPRLAMLTLNLASTLFDQGHSTEAFALLETPESIQMPAAAYQTRAYMRLRSGELKQAEADARKAIALDPTLSEAHATLSAALQRSRRLAEAEKVAREGIAMAPEHSACHRRLGDVFLVRKQPREALACYNRASELGEAKVDARVGMIRALQDCGEHEEAYRQAEWLVQTLPRYGESWLAWGMMQSQRGETQRAEDAFRRATTLDSRLGNAFFNLGNSHHARGDLDGAIACYKKAIPCMDAPAEGLTNLGMMLLIKGQSQEARGYIDQALTLDPDFGAAHAALGTWHEHSREPERARVCYERAAVLSPTEGMPLHQLSILLRRVGRLQEATLAAQEATKRSPKEARFWSQYTTMLLLTNDGPEAVKAATTWIKLAPGQGHPYAGLSDAYFLAGKFTEGAAAARKAAELAPNGPLRKIADTQLRRCQAQEKADQRLTAMLAGTEKEPETILEMVNLALLATKWRKRPALAASLFEKVFARDPQVAEQRQGLLRAAAAAAAVQASAGVGDGAQLDEETRLRWRKQALTWLQAEVWLAQEALRQPGSHHAAVQAAMREWWTDARLASVSEGRALAKMPKEEREAWRRLWREHAELCATR